jgi:hypothetical protein
MEFNDLLVEESVLTKLAVEGPNQQQVEQDFGRMAYAFLKDRAPSLIEHLIGFEIVEQEPDGSRAVGLFGFDVGGRYFYVPTFFLSNQIKGMDLLYDKGADMFYPLRENWINHILNKQTIQLGDAAPPQTAQDFDTPDFTAISDPPLGGSTKLSAHQMGHNLADTWNKMQRTVVDSLENDESFKSAYANAVLAMKGEPHIKEASYLTEFIEQKGGPKMAHAVAEKLQDVAFLKAASVFYDYSELLINDFSEALAPKEAKDVRVVTRELVEDYSKDLNDKDRTRIVEDGFTLQDTREEDDKSDVYTVDYASSIQNPDYSGECDVVLSSGACTPCYVSTTPFGAGSPGCVLVINKDSKRFFTAHERVVFVREALNESDKTNAPLYDDAVDIGDMELDATYVLVDEKGQTSIPFKTQSITSEDGEDVRIKVRWCNSLDFDSDYEGSNYPRAHIPEANPNCLPTWGESSIIPVDRVGGLRISAKNLVTPTQSWKAVKLTDKDHSSMECKAFSPGTYTEVKENLLKMAYHDVVIENMGPGIGYNICIDGTVSQDNLDAKEASLYIAKDLGIDATESLNIMDQVKQAGTANRLVKFAQQVVMPQVPPQYVGFDAQVGVPVEPAQLDYVEGQTQNYVPPYVGPGDSIQMGGEGERQQQAAVADPTQLAQQAAAAGQQQVFDHSVIGGLAQTYDVSFAVDSYVPDLLKALDRIGRILFLFYWKNVDFAERYGDQDLTAMEDQLRGVFKSLGDLTLKLKQKTIDAEGTEFVDGGAI